MQVADVWNGRVGSILPGRAFLSHRGSRTEFLRPSDPTHLPYTTTCGIVSCLRIREWAFSAVHVAHSPPPNYTHRGTRIRDASLRSVTIGGSRFSC